MKGRCLVSHILLSIVIFFLLSMATQATEYREANTEVKAEEILKHIENGEDINLTSCHIVGELNVSNIILKTVPNPHFYELMDLGLDKGYIVEKGVSEEYLHVVESNIQIKNSIFEKHLDFSNVVFNAPINFSESTFNDTADFSESTFNGSVNFTDTTFDSTDFSLLTFNAPTNFNRSKFHGNVYFNESVFHGNVYFNGAIFHDSADFSRSTFNDITTFSPYTEHLKNFVILIPTKFYSNADFSGSTFNAPTNFDGLIFDDSADFSFATFNDTTDFVRSVFNAPIDFGYSTFNGDVNFSYTTFNFSGDLSGPEKFEKIITNTEKVCDFFRKFYKNEARYNDADTIYYEYRKAAMNSESLMSISKWIDVLSWITCGYGVRPFNAFLFGIIVVFLFYVIYINPICLKINRDKRMPIRLFINISLNKSSNKIMPFKLSLKSPGIVKESDPSYKASPLDLFYYSIGVFTFISQGSWYPRENFKKWVTLEGILGWATLGIFMATLTALIIRS